MKPNSMSNKEYIGLIEVELAKQKKYTLQLKDELAKEKSYSHDLREEMEAMTLERNEAINNFHLSQNHEKELITENDQLLKDIQQLTKIFSKTV